MARAILAFRLPQEEAEFRDARDGTLWHGIVQSLDELMRVKVKYGSDLTIAELREFMLQMVLDEGLMLWD